MRKGDASAGFTLIEVVVALVIGSVLLVSLGWMIREIRSSWTRSGKQIERTRAQLVVEDRLRQTLGALIVQERPDAESSFVGGARGFTARVPAPAAVARLGLVDVHIAVLPRAEGAALVMRVAAALPATRSSVAGGYLQEQILLDGLTDVEFVYLQRGSSGLTRQAAWSAADGTPAAIVIRTRDRATSQAVHEIVIRPVGNVDPRCRFDPVSLGCRLAA